MVFFFVAGPVGIFGGGNGMFGGPNMGGHRGLQYRGQNDMQQTLLLSLVMLVVTFGLSASYPYLVPLLSIAAQFMPHDVQTWMTDNRVAVLLVLFLMFNMWVYNSNMNDVGDHFGSARSESAHSAEQRTRRAAATASAAGGAGRSDPGVDGAQHRRAPSTGVDGFDGSWGGNVFIDFGFTILLMTVTFALPRIWVLVNRRVLEFLPEQHRETWRSWTEFIRPSSPPPGGVPASRDSVRNLESVVIDQSHLVAEESTTGVMCPVCLDEMVIGQAAKRLPCAHLFHDGCIRPWLDKHNSCPTCRHELPTSDPEFEYHRLERQRRQEERDRERRARQSPANSPSRGTPRTSPPSPRPAWSPAAGPTLRRPRSAAAAAEAERLMNLSIPELRAIARRQMIDLTGCVEKRDVVERIANRGIVQS